MPIARRSSIRTDDSLRSLSVAPGTHYDYGVITKNRRTRKRFEVAQQARFLTFSCYHRLELFGNDTIRDAFVDALAASRDRTKYELVKPIARRSSIRTDDSLRSLSVAPGTHYDYGVITKNRRTRKRFEVAQQARFLTFSCYHRLELFGNDTIRDAFVDALAASRDRTKYELNGWVIMPEHVHLLIVPNLPKYSVSHVLKDLKGLFANRVLQRWRKVDAPIRSRITDPRGKLHFWQKGGGYDRNIVSDDEFHEKLNYIHNNPVTRGLAQHPTDWTWSSARWYAGQRSTDVLAIDPPTH